MSIAPDNAITDRTAPTARAASPGVARSPLAAARAELFARTFAVWRLRADADGSAGSGIEMATPPMEGAPSREPIAHEGTTRAWRDLIEQVAHAPTAADAARAADAPRARERTRTADDVEHASEVRSARERAAARRHDRSADDPTVPVKDPSTLDPALRDRLERVIARMEQAGHVVTITETSRSQSRQDALYAQGRNAPGQVVTWTRQSRHTDGLAVDVQVDGSWDNAEGYALLQTVASAEGLSTLGSKDRGHLELRAEDAIASLDQMASVREARIEIDRPTSRLDRKNTPRALARAESVAPVAAVAQVATVARVAPVASTAIPAVGVVRSDAPVAERAAVGGGAPPSLRGIIDPAAVRPVAGAVVPQGTGEHAGPNGGESRESDRQGQSPVAAVVRGGRATATGSVAAALAGVMGAGGSLRTGFVGTTAALRGSSLALRADEIQSLLEARDRQPVSRMMLTVDDEAGGVDHIRVDVRGARVGADINFGEAGDAAHAATRVNELARALEQRGLSPDGLRVANAAAGASADVARSALLSALRTGSAMPRPGNPDRTSHDQPRQRSRREQGDPR